MLGARALEEFVNLRRELAVIGHSTFSLLRTAAGLDKLPFGTHILDLGPPVSLGVVTLTETSEALPERQMSRVDSNTVVLTLLAIPNIVPAALLLLKIKTSSIGKKDPCQKHASETKPWDDVELSLVINVVVENGSEKSAGFADTGGEAVGSSTDGRGEYLTSHEEGDRVGTELVEEGRYEVHGLERMDSRRTGVVVELEGGNNEHQEAHEEAHLLHHLPAVHLVVDEKRCEIVASQGDGDIDKVPGPSGEDRLAVRRDDLDELTLEKLVAVEEDIVAEPSTSSSKETSTEVGKAVAKSVHVIAGDVRALLCLSELLTSAAHAVSTIVEEPERTDGRECKRQSESILGSRLAVGRRTLAVVEDGEQNNENDLVHELAPALHEESRGDTATTMQTIFTSRDPSTRRNTFKRRSCCNGVLATNTETVKEERPGITDNPALKGKAP